MTMRTTRIKWLAPALLCLAALAAACGTAEPAATRQPSTPAVAPLTVEDSAATKAENAPLGELSEDEVRAAATYSGQGGWETDFMRRTVELTELNLGCFPKDCICSIGNTLSQRCGSEPVEFHSVTDAFAYLEVEDPAVVININGAARAYPLAILTHHEIVNDVAGGLPIAVTYCPLCNSALVFARLDSEGRELEFGVSGFLVNSDLVMWDRQTESLWQQFTGRGIAGQHAGSQLRILPSVVTSLDEFRKSYPDGQVLAGPLFNGNYTSRPYAGYEQGLPFLFNGMLDERLRATSRVLGLTVGGTSVAYAWTGLMQDTVQQDTVNGTEIAIFYDPGTLSTFDAQGGRPESRGVSGSAAAFVPEARGMRLDFELRDGVIKDRQTGSTWSPSGVALEGDLSGEMLEIVPSGNHFWFAWVAFNPETEIRGA